MYAFDKTIALREVAHYEAVVSRIQARGVSTMAQRDALASAENRLREERNAVALLTSLEGR